MSCGDGEELTGGQMRDRQEHAAAEARIAAKIAELDVAGPLPKAQGLSDEKRGLIAAMAMAGRGVEEIAAEAQCAYSTAYKYSRAIRRGQK